MTASLKVIFAGVLAAGTLLAENTISAIAKEVKTENLLLAQTPAKSQAVALPIALPDFATITLKGGKSHSGKMIELDPQKQILTLQRRRKTSSIPLNKIEKVQFDEKSSFYRSDGRLIMRGEQKPQAVQPVILKSARPPIRGEQKQYTGKPVILNGVPLDTFTIKNPNQGQAEVTLAPPVVSPAELLGIQLVAKDRQYVVDEIQFNPQKRTMTIQATPY